MLIAEVSVAGERLLLHPHRALFWPRPKWLVVSDLHLGKAAHFRKAGTPLPETLDVRTLERLEGTIAEFRPDRVIILGDLFHSAHNNGWDRFASWCSLQRVPIHLVPGNHDILADRRYSEAGLTVCDESIEEGPFVLTHEPAARRGGYVIAGHVHPGVMLRGNGKQQLRLPCFSFSDRLGILPAFGAGTGLFIQRSSQAERIFAVTDRAVIDVGASVPTQPVGGN